MFRLFLRLLLFFYLLVESVLRYRSPFFSSSFLHLFPVVSSYYFSISFSSFSVSYSCFVVVVFLVPFFFARFGGDSDGP